MTWLRTAIVVLLAAYTGYGLNSQPCQDLSVWPLPQSCILEKQYSYVCTDFMQILLSGGRLACWDDYNHSGSSRWLH
jgi:hypothetical protein